MAVDAYAGSSLYVAFPLFDVAHGANLCMAFGGAIYARIGTFSESTLLEDGQG